MGTQFVWEDEKVTEIVGGDNYKTIWMYLIPPNCILKNIKMVNFMFSIFYTIKKMFKCLAYYPVFLLLNEFESIYTTVCF